MNQGRKHETPHHRCSQRPPHPLGFCLLRRLTGHTCDALLKIYWGYGNTLSPQAKQTGNCREYMVMTDGELEITPQLPWGKADVCSPRASLVGMSPKSTVITGWIMYILLSSFPSLTHFPTLYFLGLPLK